MIRNSPDRTVKAQTPSECEWGKFIIKIIMDTNGSLEVGYLSEEELNSLQGGVTESLAGTPVKNEPTYGSTDCCNSW